MGAMADLAGEDNLIWASDFPHSDAKYPGRRRRADGARRGPDRADGSARSSVRTRRGSTASRTSTSGAPRRTGAACLSSTCSCVGAPSSTARGLPPYTADVGVRDGRDHRGRPPRATSRGADHRRRRLRRRAGLRRHPHALRRAAALRADRVAVVVARRHHRHHRQLRVLAVPVARPDDVAWLCDMLSRVEGMSPATLAEGVGVRGRRDERLRRGRSTAGIGVNVGLQVGHSALRRHVLGDDAGTRTATECRDRRDAGPPAHRARRGCGRVLLQPARHARGPARQPGAVEPRRRPTSWSRWRRCSPTAPTASSSSSAAATSRATTTPTASSCSRCARRRASP